MDKALLDKIDECNAIHEAGHAVMAALMGTSIHSIALPIADVINNFGHVRRNPATDPWSEVLIKFAGPGAEVVHRGVTWSDVFRCSGRGDWREAQRFLMAKDRKSRRAIVANAKSDVLQFLRNNWPWVKDVSTTLLSERYLSGDQVLSLRS